MGGGIGLIVFICWILLIQTQPIEVSRSLVMTLMVFLQNWHAFNCKSEKRSIFTINPFTNWFFALSSLGSIGLQVLFMEVESLSHLLDLVTIPYSTMFMLLGVSFLIIGLCEILKICLRAYDKRKNPLVS